MQAQEVAETAQRRELVFAEYRHVCLGDHTVCHVGAHAFADLLRLGHSDEDVVGPLSRYLGALNSNNQFPNNLPEMMYMLAIELR